MVQKFCRIRKYIRATHTERISLSLSHSHTDTHTRTQTDPDTIIIVIFFFSLWPEEGTLEINNRLNILVFRIGPAFFDDRSDPLQHAKNHSTDLFLAQLIPFSSEKAFEIIKVVSWLLLSSDALF